MFEIKLRNESFLKIFTLILCVQTVSLIKICENSENDIRTDLTNCSNDNNSDGKSLITNIELVDKQNGSIKVSVKKLCKMENYIKVTLYYLDENCTNKFSNKEKINVIPFNDKYKHSYVEINLTAGDKNKNVSFFFYLYTVL